MRFWKRRKETREEELREYNRCRFAEELSMAPERAMEWRGCDVVSHRSGARIWNSDYNVRVRDVADVFLELGFAIRPYVGTAPERLREPTLELEPLDSDIDP